MRRMGLWKTEPMKWGLLCGRWRKYVHLGGTNRSFHGTIVAMKHNSTFMNDLLLTRIVI